MNIVIYGNDAYLRKLELSKFTNGFDKNSISFFDMNNDSLKDIIEDFNTMSLFSLEKIVIINNSYIFSSKKCEIEQDADLLIKYFDNPNPSIKAIFVVDSESLDIRKKVTKKIKEIGKVIDVNSVSDITHFVRTLFEGYKVSPKAIELLISRTSKNLQLISNEVLKLKQYKEDFVITEDDIINVCSKVASPDIFLFVDAIINRDIKTAYSIYSDLMVVNEEPIKIIVMLSNQFRLMYQSKIMNKRGYDLNYIARELDVHPFRVKLAIEKSRSYTEDLILSYIKKLSDLDYQIKYGELDKFMAFEMFILSI